MKKKILGLFIFTLLIVAAVIPATGNTQKKPVSPLISTSIWKPKSRFIECLSIWQ